MLTKKVLGVDPGDTTGYALAEVVFDQGEWALDIINCGDADFPDGVQALLSRSVLPPKPDVVVIEDYIIRQPHIGQSPIAIKVIGVLEVIFHCTPVQVVLQQPSEKSRFPDTRLFKYGIEKTGVSAHARDAIRHIAIWAQKVSGHES